MNARAPERETRCSASRLLREVGVRDCVSAESDALTFSTRRRAPRTVLARQGDKLGALYVVLAGCLKAEIAAVQGDAQVNAFYLHGDTVGLDGLADRVWHRTVTAVEASLVAQLPLDQLADSIRDTQAMTNFFQHVVGRELDLQSRLHYIVAPPAAESRLARFLVDLAARQAQPGQPATTAMLAMSRADLANHLGLAHETISRAFAALIRMGCIEVRGKEVRLLEIDALQNFRPGRRLRRARSAVAVQS
jgi:CRP/FNR family transcriptional regulator